MTKTELAIARMHRLYVKLADLKDQLKTAEGILRDEGMSDLDVQSVRIDLNHEYLNKEY